MTKSNVHAILADLHKLLSIYRSVDFMDASNYAGIPRPLRDALRALALEAPTVINGSVKDIASARLKSPSDRKRDLNHHRGETPTLLNLIRRSPYFRSTSSMVEYADNIGLKLPVRAKESRERVARRLASLVDELPDSRKKWAIDGLVTGKNNQTQGWIDVIKNRN